MHISKAGRKRIALITVIIFITAGSSVYILDRKCNEPPRTKYSDIKHLYMLTRPDYYGYNLDLLNLNRDTKNNITNESLTMKIISISHSTRVVSNNSLILNNDGELFPKNPRWEIYIKPFDVDTSIEMQIMILINSNDTNLKEYIFFGDCNEMELILTNNGDSIKVQIDNYQNVTVTTSPLEIKIHLPLEISITLTGFREEKLIPPLHCPWVNRGYACIDFP